MHSLIAWQTGPIVRHGRQRYITLGALAALLLPLAPPPGAQAALNDSLKPDFASKRTSKWLRARSSSREARIARLQHKKENHIPQPITLAPPIEGQILTGSFGVGVTNLEVFLVRPLSPETKQHLDRGAKIFASLRSKPGIDISKPVVAPANAAILQKALAELRSGVPKPANQDMQIAQVGAVKLAPSPALATKYTQHFRSIEPALIRRDLRTIDDLLREDMMEQEKILGIGYLGSLQEIDFFGLVREGGGPDIAQARKIAQAAVDQLWLTELCEFVAKADATAAQVPLKNGTNLSPEEEWNAFYLSDFHDLDFEIQLRVLDTTTPGPKGEFRLWGEGDIVVGVRAYQELVYIPEGINNGAPIRVTRISNGKEKK